MKNKIIKPTVKLKENYIKKIIKKLLKNYSKCIKKK